MRRHQQKHHSNIHRIDHFHQRSQSMKSISNPLYDEIQQSLSSDDLQQNHINTQQELNTFEYPILFNRVLKHQHFQWYPFENKNQIHNTSDDEEFNRQVIEI